MNHWQLGSCQLILRQGIISPILKPGKTGNSAPNSYVEFCSRVCWLKFWKKLCTNNWKHISTRLEHTMRTSMVSGKGVHVPIYYLLQLTTGWSQKITRCPCLLSSLTVSKAFDNVSHDREEICSISSRSRVLAHRPCPKLEMFLPIGSTTFLRLQQSSDDQSRHVFFVFVFMFFKPAGDPSSATLVPDLANQVWPFKSALFKTSRPGKRSWLTRETSATERHGNDRLSKKGRPYYKINAKGPIGWAINSV